MWLTVRRTESVESPPDSADVRRGYNFVSPSFRGGLRLEGQWQTPVDSESVRGGQLSAVGTAPLEVSNVRSPGPYKFLRTVLI